MHGHDGHMSADMADRHAAHRRQMPFGSPGASLGMHSQLMAEAMHMGGRRYPGAGGMGHMHGRGHMMWYKDAQEMGPREGRGHPGGEGFYGGMGGMGLPADHPTSNARLQQQVNYLLTENHSLRCHIRAMSQERDDFARQSDGLSLPSSLSLPLPPVRLTLCPCSCAIFIMFVPYG